MRLHIIDLQIKKVVIWSYREQFTVLHKGYKMRFQIGQVQIELKINDIKTLKGSIELFTIREDKHISLTISNEEMHNEGLTVKFNIQSGIPF